jgi:uracil-DNA glycosylase
LFETGFANISKSESKNDGLLLKDVFIRTAVRCAPPNNTPTSLEIFNCSQYLLSELIILDPTIKVVLTLGKIAFCTFCRIRSLPRLRFGHNTRYDIGNGKTFWLLIIQVDRIQTPENLHGKCGYLFLEPQNS